MLMIGKRELCNREKKQICRFNVINSKDQAFSVIPVEGLGTSPFQSHRFSLSLCVLLIIDVGFSIFAAVVSCSSASYFHFRVFVVCLFFKQVTRSCWFCARIIVEGCRLIVPYFESLFLEMFLERFSTVVSPACVLAAVTDMQNFLLSTRQFYR